MKPLLVYISGPYSADAEEGKLRNTQAAIEAGIEIMRKGHYALIPHLSHFTDSYAREIEKVDFSWEFWMKIDLAILERCDALFYIGTSKGADIELDKAIELGLDIYHDVSEVLGVSE